jgi:hypothetical protein
MNRGSLIRGLLALSVPGVGLIAAGIGVAAGCRVCITSQPVAWAIMIGPAVVVAGLLWIVLAPVVERPPAKPAAAARHRWHHAAAATAS